MNQKKFLTIIIFNGWKRRTGIGTVTDEEIHRCRTAYYGLVDQMDKMIGNIIQCLHDQKIFENTIVVYTDHGEQTRENGYGGSKHCQSSHDSLPSVKKNDSAANQYFKLFLMQFKTIRMEKKFD